jgi:hypothetical protein
VSEENDLIVLLGVFIDDQVDQFARQRRKMVGTYVAHRAFGATSRQQSQTD